MVICRSKKISCWWFGCKSDGTPDVSPCGRCGGSVSYSDRVGDTRHNKLVSFVRFWVVDRWAKCKFCGKRFECDGQVDHVGF